MTYIMLCGRRPFERIDIPNNPEASEASLVSNIVMGRYHFNHEPFRHVSDDAIHFICSCLEPNPAFRLSAETLLKHRWLSTSGHEPVNAVDGPSTSGGMQVENPSVSLAQDAAVVSVPTAETQAQYALRTELARTSMLGVAFSLPPTAAKQLRSLFNDLDADKTGYIDRNEFLQAVTNSLVTPASSSEINQLFDMIDVDRNHRISFIEFLAAMLDPRTVDIQDLNQAFHLFDKENKGYITATDIYHIIGTNMEESTIKAAVEEKKLKQQLSLQGEQSNDGSSDAELRAAAEREHLEVIKAKVAHMVQECDVDGDGNIRLEKDAVS
jgi:Ca2+-binding EF-hand superfamily protein